jgi:hypothetical protein
MLLRLTSTLRNGNGDISMREFEEVSKESHVSTIKSNAQSSDTEDFMSLDAVSELLVRDREIISTCYTTKQRRHFTAVTQSHRLSLPTSICILRVLARAWRSDHWKLQLLLILRCQMKQVLRSLTKEEIVGQESLKRKNGNF